GWQNLPLSLVGLLRRGHPRVVFPFPEDNQAVVEEIRDHLAAGTFRPVIDRTYALADIVAAYRYLEAGQKIGNVVVTPSPSCPDTSAGRDRSRRHLASAAPGQNLLGQVRRRLHAVGVGQHL